MRILHYYPNADSMVTRYVATLCDMMGIECVNERTTEKEVALQLIEDGNFDIVHLHGCWENTLYTITRRALKKGCRLVVSPHGQLEPWVQEENYWKEKLPKRILYQKEIVQKAYAIVIQGHMEEECLKKLGWNSRLQIIRNCLITQSIGQQQMAGMMSKLYRKVMDSDTLNLMDNDTRSALKAIITAGITGDERWLESTTAVSQWRELLCYAYQEQIDDIVQRGINILRQDGPDFDAKTADYFLPDRYVRPESIKQAIGNNFASENERLEATFKYLRKLAAKKQLNIRHLAELDKELRLYECNEAELCETLKEQNNYKLACRIMQLMSDRTGLTEGFMPIPPLNDRTTQKMRKQIDNYLKI